MRLQRLMAVCAVLIVLAGCATVPRDPAALGAFKATNDPLEPLNRKTFAFNQGVDRFLLKPIAKAYVWVIPHAGRDGIRNFIQNLHERAKDFVRAITACWIVGAKICNGTMQNRRETPTVFPAVNVNVAEFYSPFVSF